jgi:hypothetical protein
MSLGSRPQTLNHPPKTLPILHLFNENPDHSKRFCQQTNHTKRFRDIGLRIFLTEYAAGLTLPFTSKFPKKATC